jgi:cobalt-zinc-cadmium efflux system membrane fusion protein
MKTFIATGTATLLTLSLCLAACSDRAADQSASAATHAEEEAEHHHDEEPGRVHLDDEQIRTAGIILATAGPARIREALPVYGSIAPNAERVHAVSARFPGVIRSVGKAVGDAVRQGDVLATVESNESLRTYDIVAPLSGVITARDANTGEQSGERSLFTVADLSTVWVELALFPRDLSKVHVGQTVRVRSVDAGLAADGRVVYVAPFGSGASQTRSARVELANPDRRWAPGLYVSAEIVLSQANVPVAVRNEALQVMDGRDSVFVEVEPGEFAATPVRLGRSDGETSEVLDGLAAGARYVAAGSFVLKSQLGAASAEHEH